MSLDEGLCVLHKEIWVTLNISDSFSTTDPGRIIHTVAIKSVIFTVYVQKAASDLLLWAHTAAKLWKWLPLWFLSAFQTSAVLSVWFWRQIFERSTKLCHQMPTHSFTSERFSERRETLAPIPVSLLEGTRGESKINGFNFILANQIPIKLKEKLKSGQCEQ